MALPVILLAFANDDGRSLRQLDNEQKALREALQQVKRDGKCRVEVLVAATAEDIIKAFQDYRGRIRIFHYGGHSNRDSIFLKANYPSEKGTKAENLAGFLALQKGLRLIFMNSCLSLEQAKTYWEAGAETVIATNQLLGDQIARNFAELFYKSLATGATIAEAFQEAEKTLALIESEQYRSTGFMLPDDEFPWQIYPDDVGQWRLPLVAKHLTRIPSIDLAKELLGREADMERLKVQLENTSKVVLMNGLGGIGKTVLATAYVKQYGGNYDHLIWINRGEDLVSAIALNIELAETLGMPIQPEEVLFDRFTRILHKLYHLPGQNLMVIDNAQEQIAQKEIYDLLPNPKNWRVLLTSRLSLNGFDLLSLGTLSKAAAIQLFTTYYQGSYTDEDLRDLLEAIDYHTLTIELLAKLLDRLNNVLTIDELTEILKIKQLDNPDLQEKIRTRHSGKEQGIYLHLTKAFELTQITDRETWLLKQFVCLPVEQYAVADLANLLQEKPLALNKLLNSLADKGWLSRHEDKSFSIHRLIRKVLEYQLKPVYADVKTLVSSISDLLYTDQSKDNPVDKFPLVIFGESITATIPDSEEGDFAGFQSNLATVYQALGEYEQARDLLKLALESALRNFGADHSSTAVRRSNLALVYKDLGEYEQARDLLKLALESALRNFGADHPSTARNRSNLALVYKDLGEYEQARDLLKLALESDLRNYGADHSFTAIRRSNLATVYQALGEYEQARDLLKLALESDLRNFGADHPSTARNRSNLATVYQDLGEYEQARDLLKLALDSDLRNFGADHPSTARSRSNLALVYQDLGEYEQAWDLLKLALDSALRNFGADHPSTAISRSNLATVYQALGEYEQARDLLKLALDSDLRNFGADHPSTASSRSNLATVYKDLGEYEQARDLLKLTLESDLRNFGADHPSTARSRSNLALVYQDLGEYEQARDLLKLALESALRNYGADHPYTAISRSNLATVYQDLGEYEQARDLLKLALESDLRNFGAAHPSTARRRSNLATVYQDLGEYEQARDLLKLALESALRNYGADHPSTARSRSNLALVYQDLGEYEQARDLLKLALESDLRNFGAAHPSTAIRRSNLATVYKDLGEYEQARDLFEKAYATFEKLLGKDHPNTKIVKEWLDSLK